MASSNKRLYVLLGLAAFLLSIPGMAMLFTKEVNWSALDFAAAFFLLFGTVALAEIILRRVKTIRWRWILILGLLLALVLVWLELAVGIFGTPVAGH